MRWFAAAVAVSVISGSAGAKQLPPAGSASTLDVATWNVEMFGNSGGGPSDEVRQLENVARVIADSGIELWSLQELADETVLDDLLEVLGSDWGGALSESSNLHMAFVYRTDTVVPGSITTELAIFASDFAGRPPLFMRATVALPDTSLSLLFVALHMKCCDDARSYEQRADAASRLKNRLDFAHPSEPIVVLGDFNDLVLGSIRFAFDSPYRAFVEDSVDYRFATQHLEENGTPTFCGSSGACTTGSTIDHILVTNELFDTHVFGSAATYREVLDAIDGFVFTTSDHLPVVARFSFASGTGTERPEFAVRAEPALYPVPARSSLVVQFGTPTIRSESVTLFDVLGRARSTTTVRGGDRTAVLETGDLAPGVYLVSGNGWARTVVVAR